MSDDKPKPDAPSEASPKPDPIEDVRQGLGLLLRAAKSAVEKLPTREVEQAVLETAREVGRAVENVAKTVEREVFGAKHEPKKGQEKTERSEDKEDKEPPTPA